MKGLKVLESALLIYLIVLGTLAFRQPPRIELPSSGVFFVLYDNGYWKVNEDGWLIGVANDSDILKNVVVSGIDPNGLKVSDSDMKVLKGLKILNDPYVSSLNLRERYVITVKGMVLYFRRWEDLNRYFEKFKKRMEYFSPKSVFYLYEGGRLVILRGD